MIFMKRILTVLVISSIVLIIFSFFLPYYEGPRGNSAIKSTSFVVMRIYELPEFGPMFVFNGFGSLFAIFNLVQAIVLCSGFFLFPRALATPIVVTVLLILSLLLVKIGNSAGWGRPFGDSMMSGFYYTIIGMSVLITCSFVKSIYLLKNNQENSNMRDF